MLTSPVAHLFADVINWVRIQTLAIRKRRNAAVGQVWEVLNVTDANPAIGDYLKYLPATRVAPVRQSINCFMSNLKCRFTACGCSSFGSVREDCEQMTGRCVCKPGIQGQKCTICTSHDKVLGPNGCVPGELLLKFAT